MEREVVWAGNYAPIEQCDLNDEMFNNRMQRAAMLCRDFFGYKANEGRLVVVCVDGYYCVAALADIPIDDKAIVVHEEVFPFDNRQVYPMQGLEVKLSFKRFY